MSLVIYWAQTTTGTRQGEFVTLFNCIALFFCWFFCIALLVQVQLTACYLAKWVIRKAPHQSPLQPIHNLDWYFALTTSLFDRNLYSIYRNVSMVPCPAGKSLMSPAVGTLLSFSQSPDQQKTKKKQNHCFRNENANVEFLYPEYDRCWIWSEREKEPKLLLYMNENWNIDCFMVFSQNKSIRRKTMEILSLSLTKLFLNQLLVVPPKKSNIIIEPAHANSPPKGFPIEKRYK